MLLQRNCLNSYITCINPLQNNRYVHTHTPKSNSKRNCGRYPLPLVPRPWWKMISKVYPQFSHHSYLWMLHDIVRPRQSTKDLVRETRNLIAENRIPSLLAVWGWWCCFTKELESEIQIDGQYRLKDAKLPIAPTFSRRDTFPMV